MPENRFRRACPGRSEQLTGYTFSEKLPFARNSLRRALPDEESFVRSGKWGDIVSVANQL